MDYMILSSFRTLQQYASAGGGFLIGSNIKLDAGFHKRNPVRQKRGTVEKKKEEDWISSTFALNSLLMKVNHQCFPWLASNRQDL